MGGKVTRGCTRGASGLQLHRGKLRVFGRLFVRGRPLGGLLDAFVLCPDFKPRTTPRLGVLGLNAEVTVVGLRRARLGSWKSTRVFLRRFPSRSRRESTGCALERTRGLTPRTFLRRRTRVSRPSLALTRVHAGEKVACACARTAASSWESWVKRPVRSFKPCAPTCAVRWMTCLLRRACAVSGVEHVYICRHVGFKNRTSVGVL